MIPPNEPPADSHKETPETKQRKFYEKFKRDIKKPRFAVEIAVLVVLIVYTSATLYQSCKMREATEATKQSAETAVATVRAWLVLTGTETEVEGVDKIPPDPMIPVGIIHFRNVGKTPATDIIGYLDFKTQIIAPNSEPTFTKCPKRIARREPVVNADSISEVWAVPNTFTDRERQLIDSGKAVPRIHGCITYHDILNPKQVRLTEFTGFVQGYRGIRDGRPVILQPHWETFTIRTK
jgi:hypothetical protein